MAAAPQTDSTSEKFEAVSGPATRSDTFPDKMTTPGTTKLSEMATPASVVPGSPVDPHAGQQQAVEQTKTNITVGAAAQLDSMLMGCLDRSVSDRQFCLDTEAILRRFLEESSSHFARGDEPLMDLPPENTFFRRLQHIVASRFGVGRDIVGVSRPSGVAVQLVRVFRLPDSRIPQVLLVDMVKHAQKACDERLVKVVHDIKNDSASPDTEAPTEPTQPVAASAPTNATPHPESSPTVAAPKEPAASFVSVSQELLGKPAPFITGQPYGAHLQSHAQQGCGVGVMHQQQVHSCNDGGSVGGSSGVHAHHRRPAAQPYPMPHALQNHHQPRLPSSSAYSPTSSGGHFRSAAAAGSGGGASGYGDDPGSHSPGFGEWRWQGHGREQHVNHAHYQHQPDNRGHGPYGGNNRPYHGDSGYDRDWNSGHGWNPAWNVGPGPGPAHHHHQQHPHHRPAGHTASGIGTGGSGGYNGSDARHNLLPQQMQWQDRADGGGGGGYHQRPHPHAHRDNYREARHEHHHQQQQQQQWGGGPPHPPFVGEHSRSQRSQGGDPAAPQPHNPHASASRSSDASAGACAASPSSTSSSFVPPLTHQSTSSSSSLASPLAQASASSSASQPGISPRGDDNPAAGDASAAAAAANVLLKQQEQAQAEQQTDPTAGQSTHDGAGDSAFGSKHSDSGNGVSRGGRSFQPRESPPHQLQHPQDHQQRGSGYPAPFYAPKQAGSNARRGGGGGAGSGRGGGRRGNNHTNHSSKHAGAGTATTTGPGLVLSEADAARFAALLAMAAAATGLDINALVPGVGSATATGAATDHASVDATGAGVHTDSVAGGGDANIVDVSIDLYAGPTTVTSTTTTNNAAAVHLHAHIANLEARLHAATQALRDAKASINGNEQQQLQQFYQQQQHPQQSTLHGGYFTTAPAVPEATGEGDDPTAVAVAAHRLANLQDQLSQLSLLQQQQGQQMGVMFGSQPQMMMQAPYPSLQQQQLMQPTMMTAPVPQLQTAQHLTFMQQPQQQQHQAHSFVQWAASEASDDGTGGSGYHVRGPPSEGSGSQQQHQQQQLHEVHNPHYHLPATPSMIDLAGLSALDTSRISVAEDHSPPPPQQFRWQDPRHGHQQSPQRQLQHKSSEDDASDFFGYYHDTGGDGSTGNDACPTPGFREPRAADAFATAAAGSILNVAANTSTSSGAVAYQMMAFYPALLPDGTTVMLPAHALTSAAPGGPPMVGTSPGHGGPLVQQQYA